MFEEGIQEGALVDGISLEVGEGDGVLGVGLQVVLGLVLGRDGGAGELPLAGHDVGTDKGVEPLLGPSTQLLPQGRQLRAAQPFQRIQGFLLCIVREKESGGGGRGKGVEGSDATAHALGEHNRGGFKEGAEVAEAGPSGEGQVVG